MKIGRNAPCPCGSGNKYKKCCLEKEKAENLQYKRLEQAQQELVEKMTKYVLQDLGDAALSAALMDFFQDDSDLAAMWQEVLDDFLPVFWPWLFYNLNMEASDIEEFGAVGRIQPNTTVAEMYVREKGAQLDTLEQAVLSSVNRTPFSFFEVKDVQPGQGFQAEDLLTGQRYTVTDLSGSQGLERGDIIYSLIASVQEYTLHIGYSPYTFPPRFKSQIIELRMELRDDYEQVTADVLLEEQHEIRDLFIYLHDSLFGTPELSNFDEEELSIRTLYYDIDSAEEAFAALCPLSVLETEPELRDLAELDDRGQVQKIHFTWDKTESNADDTLDSITLGFIRIEGKTMTVEVNSEEREVRIRQEIDSRLGKKAVYRVTDIRSMDSFLNETEYDPDENDLEREDLQQQPEVLEAMQKVLEKHWQGWLDTELPALGGLTPRQASETAEGREMVQALLRDMEASEVGSRMPVSQQPYIEAARQELGLPDPSVPEE